MAHAVELARPTAEDAEVVRDEAQARAQVAELRRDARLVEVAVVQLPELHVHVKCRRTMQEVKVRGNRGHPRIRIRQKIN